MKKRDNACHLYHHGTELFWRYLISSSLRLPWNCCLGTVISSEPRLDADVFYGICCQCDLSSRVICSMVLKCFGEFHGKYFEKKTENTCHCCFARGLMIVECWSSFGMCGARVSESRGMCLVGFCLCCMEIVECIGAFCFWTFLSLWFGITKGPLLPGYKLFGSSDLLVTLSCKHSGDCFVC